MSPTPSLLLPIRPHSTPRQNAQVFYAVDTEGDIQSIFMSAIGKAKAFKQSKWRVHLLCEGNKFGSDEKEDEDEVEGDDDTDSAKVDATKLLAAHYTAHRGFQVSALISISSFAAF